MEIDQDAKKHLSKSIQYTSTKNGEYKPVWLMISEILCKIGFYETVRNRDTQHMTLREITALHDYVVGYHDYVVGYDE